MPKVTREKPDTTVEKEIATGLIVDTSFIRQASQLIDTSLLKTELLQWVWRWCRDYYNRYDAAPGRNIQSIFETKRDEIDQPELVEKFLGNISSEYEREEFNRDYVLDRLKNYLREQKLRTTHEELKSAITREDYDAAEAIVAGYERPVASEVEGTNPFTDQEEIIAAHEEEVNEPLIRFPGELGRFMNNKLVREGFVGVMGPKKRGKTFLLNEFAIRAARSGRRIIHFDCGDMGKRKMYQRLHTRLAGKSSDPDHCGWKKIPVLDCIFNQMDTCHLDQRTCSFGLDGGDPSKNIDPAEWPEGYVPCNPKACGGCTDFRGAVSYYRRYIDSPRTASEAVYRGRKFAEATAHDYRLYNYKTTTLDLTEIENKMKSLEEFEGFLSDVVVIDYADIMAAEDSYKEFRHQVQDTWNGLRRISQEWHCLVIAATQCDTEGLDANILRPRNFTDFHRKLDPVTAFIGINQKDIEKRQGITRLNELAAREEFFEVTDTVTVLQCLDIGHPCLGSFRTHNETG